uniref:F-box only protein 31 n=1 Tax=Xenopus tropicalis TaxID=8364 RepID=A0A5S6MTL2_XENTR
MKAIQALRFTVIRACSTSQPKSVIAAKHPFKVELKAGKMYPWCSCGHSKKQIVGMVPLLFTIHTSETDSRNSTRTFMINLESLFVMAPTDKLLLACHRCVSHQLRTKRCGFVAANRQKILPTVMVPTKKPTFRILHNGRIPDT